MTTLSLQSAYGIAHDILYAPGKEASSSRRKALDYLDLDKKTQSNMAPPSIIRRIAGAIGCDNAMARRLINAVENEEIYSSILCQPEPATLNDLVLWSVVNEFYQEKAHLNHVGSAWKKGIEGQKNKFGIYVDGLADLVGELPARAAFYMLHNGLRGINIVKNISGLSWERISNLLAVSSSKINYFAKRISAKLLETGFVGISLIVSLISAISMSTENSKKLKKSAAIVHKADVDEDEDAVDDYLADPGPDQDDHGERDNPQVPPPPESGLDDPENPDPEDESDPDSCDPPKTPRAVAFFLLESTKMRLARMQKRTPDDQRLLDLLDLVDPPAKMVDALQKGTAGPTDPQVSQRVADVINLAWQWAARRGVFVEIPECRKFLDMPPKQFLAALIAGVRDDYLTPNAVPKPPKPKRKLGEKHEADGEDLGRIWVQVLDWETGKPARFARQTPFPATATATPAVTKDAEIIGIFTNHIRRSLPLRERKKFNAASVKLRFRSITSTDDMTQVITCEKEVHPRKKSFEDITKTGDMDETIARDPDGADTEPVFYHEIEEGLIGFNELQQLSKLINVPPLAIKSGLGGDKEKMEAVHQAITTLTPSQREHAKDMVLRMLCLRPEQVE